MRALFHAIMTVSKIGRFAWMAGWGMWLLNVTWVLFFGGDFWIPFTDSGMHFAVGNLLAGFLMLLLGIPLGLSIAHFAAVVLVLPGAAICTAIASKPENDDLMEISRRHQR